MWFYVIINAHAHVFFAEEYNHVALCYKFALHTGVCEICYFSIKISVEQLIPHLMA